LDVTGVDFNTNAHREVEDYPFYAKRLEPIDWQTEAAKPHKFCDPHFPADTSSILDENMMHPNKRWATFIWKRPCEVYGDQGYSLYDNVSPDDIKQGLCGDCYFLSGLSSLAENPARIQRIF
jgi:hypothetical protein